MVDPKKCEESQYLEIPQHDACVIFGISVFAEVLLEIL